MRRLAQVLWIAFALLAVTAWLVDPLGWRAGSASDEAAARREGAPVAQDETAGKDLRRPLRGNSASRAPERQPIEASPVEERAVFRLVDADGEPERGALVLVARGADLLLEGRSDERGEVALAPDGGEAQLVARSRRRPMELWTVRLDGGLHELRLAEGARVSGQLACENGAGVAGIQLQLDCDRLLLPADPIPDVVWATLGLEPIHTGVLFSEANQDGSFEFPGLPETWSGHLQLGRGWRVRSASRGEVEPLTGRVRLDAPAEDLLIVLAARATLRGRLVAASDGAPLAGASLCASLRAPEEPEPELLHEQADGEGRFAFATAHAAISALELRLGGLFEESLPILQLEGAAVPLDGELGELLVAGVRDVRFLLHERDGTPIRGGLARAAGIQSEPTDSEGRSVLRWLPTSARRAWAEARGFVPAEIELEAALPDPLRIQLERAALLEVRLIPPQGGSLGQFKVVVRREEGVVAGPLRDKLQQMAYVGTPSLPTADLWNAPLSSYLVATAKEPSGVASFRALALGVPLELEVRGITGPEVYHRQTLEPFSAGETRRIKVALGEGLVVFRGRVVDGGGQPLARALLQMDGAILGWTDEKGAFLFFLVDAGPGTLVLQHQAGSTLFLHDYVVPDGQEVELRLRPARNVTIEVVDEAGEPVPEAEVWILQEGFITNTHRIDENRHVASSLTDNVFRIEVRVGGRKYLQEHTSDHAEARVVVPVHGSVLARVSDATTGSRPGQLLLILRPVEGQAGDALVASHVSEPRLALEIAAVLPGRYAASIQYVPTDDERAAGRQEEQSAPLPITVQAKQRTEIQLEL